MDKYTVIGVIRLITGITCIVLTIVGLKNQFREDDYLKSLPQITTKTELQQAMNGETRTYALIGIPISGKPADAPLGILKEDYLYISYRREKYIEERSYYGDMPDTSTRWADDDGGNLLSLSDETFLFDDVPIDITKTDIDSYQRIMDESEVNLDPNTKQFFNNTKGYYYPNGDMSDSDYMDGKGIGNIRYKIFTLSMNSNVSFLANVGNEKITVYTDGNNIGTLTTGNSIDQIVYDGNGIGIGTVFLAWILFGMLWIITYFFNY